MSIKEIREAIGKGDAYFGIKQALRNSKRLKAVFVSRDVREDTIKKLESAKIEFIVLKPKNELSRELNLDFESEVFSLI